MSIETGLTVVYCLITSAGLKGSDTIADVVIGSRAVVATGLG